MDCILCRATGAAIFASVAERIYFRCGRCALTFLHPDTMPDLAEQKTQYDLHQNEPDDPGYRMFLSRLVQPLIRHLKPGSYGLDFGCGPGPALATMLNERGYVMQAYDPLYANDEDVFEETYDFITCTEVVEHLHRPAKEFALFDRLLVPGGHLAVMTAWLDDATDFTRWHYRRDPTHVCFYKPETFAWLANHYGWALELPVQNVALMHKPARTSQKK